jgi:hypothetical protein
MIGDQADMVGRLRSVLPPRWFPDSTPVLDGVLNGLAAGWAWAYGLLLYIKAQTRIATASDIWLDIIAQDLFGVGLTRRSGQSDDAFRVRITEELFRERGTRTAVIAALQDLTGRAPLVFEPARTTDTGGYGSLPGECNGAAYGAAGGWGSLSLPFQCFVTAYRPLGTGVANVSGWCMSAGGYGQGTIEYASLDMVQGQVTDSDIYAAVADVLPAATIGWTAITN